MTKAQWKAIYDYCDEYGILTADLLRELRANGTISKGNRDEMLDELSGCPAKPTYEAMIEFLESNL